MSVRARLRATVPALMPVSLADPPDIAGQPGRRMLLQRSDEEIVAQLLDDAFVARPGESVRFPAPWPRGRGTWVVAPDADLAVFAGVHAVRAVEPSGATRWEVRHGCWQGCRETHTSYDEYADRRDHRYPDSGSAGISADGALVWAHVRGPLPEGELTPDTVDEWLVLDARDGRVLARVDAGTAAAGSFHVPHPADPHQMGLSIGEGQDGAPLRWGRWDGQRAQAGHLGDDLCLLSVSPSGERLMTVSHDQVSLAVRDCGGAVVQGLEWDAESVIPRHPDAPSAGDDDDDDDPPVCWDWAGGFVDETTLVVSTVESDEEWGRSRHWLVGTTGSHGIAPVAYPSPVDSQPAALGNGAWSTLSESRDALYVWTPQTSER
ncbi:hypothetical protein OHA98_38660 [Streptomyces sp. NBC_00654]|uniref:hypothetical protein n=1 Tax=Streptomyces sp. NBC_00654 TaxID=2975799 RepID=UPI002251B5A6|nr:hypothetical protein [Streptomyces sp. NBC_00654]MCX4970572.1 hypothetical protein [Streptomyces sp. NBC_00654]